MRVPSRSPEGTLDVWLPSLTPAPDRQTNAGCPRDKRGRPRLIGPVGARPISPRWSWERGEGAAFRLFSPFLGKRLADSAERASIKS